MKVSGFALGWRWKYQGLHWVEDESIRVYIGLRFILIV